MAIRADRDGFLIGEKVDIDSRSMEKALDIWRAIRRDTQDIRKMLAAGPQRQRFARVAAPDRPRSAPVATPRARQERVGAPLPARTQEAAIPRRASQTPMRDERGRFVSREVATPRREAPAREWNRDQLRGVGGRFATSEKRAEDRSDDEQGSGKDDPVEKSPGAMTRIAASIKESLRGGIAPAVQGAEQIDPALAAAKEMSEIMAPIASVTGAAGGSLVQSWKERGERRKERRAARENAKETAKTQVPWFRRILKALDANNDGDGFGLLSGLMAGPLGKVLAPIATVLGGIAGATGLTAVGRKVFGTKVPTTVPGGTAPTPDAKGGAGKPAAKGRLGTFARGAAKVAGRALLPVAAIGSAVESFGTSSKAYADRYGTSVGDSFARDLMIRTTGVLGDLLGTVSFGLTRGLERRAGSWLFRRPNQDKNGPDSVSPKADAARVPQGGKFDPVAGVPVPKNYSEYLVALESGGKADAKAGTSSATGLHQFTRDTWMGTVREARPAWATGMSQSQVLAARTDPAKSTEMEKYLRSQNEGRLTRAGQEASAHNLYGMHHFGPKAGLAFARASGDTPMSAILSPKQLKANRYLEGKTKDQAISNWITRAAAHGVAMELPPQVAPVAQKPAMALPNFVPPAADASVSIPMTHSASRAMSAAPATAATLPSPRVMPMPKAAPAASQITLPPAPSDVTPIGSSRKAKGVTEVTLNQPLTQNLSDRGIAQLATGGMGGATGNRMA